MNNRYTVFTTLSVVTIVTVFISVMAILPERVYGARMVKAKVNKSDNTPLKWNKPEPGHIIDGANQMVVAGTNIKLYLTGGSAQIDLREDQGRVFIPAGARFKEKRTRGGFGNTLKVPLKNGGTWYNSNVRRLIFLAGRAVGSEKHPLTLEDDGWLIVRGYNAAVKYSIDEKDEAVFYRFPLRDPEAEAREAESQKRLRSRNPLVRAKEQFARAGGLKSDTYYQGGVFNGF